MISSWELHDAPPFYIDGHYHIMVVFREDGDGDSRVDGDGDSRVDGDGDSWENGDGDSREDVDGDSWENGDGDSWEDGDGVLPEETSSCPLILPAADLAVFLGSRASVRYIGNSARNGVYLDFESDRTEVGFGDPSSGYVTRLGCGAASLLEAITRGKDLADRKRRGM